MRWTGASGTRSGSGRVHFQVPYRKEGKRKAMKRLIFIVFIAFTSSLHRLHLSQHPLEHSGLPNANAKSPRFSYAISQIAPLPPVVALHRTSKSQIATRYAAFWHAISQIALASVLESPKSQRFKSQRLQHANDATKTQTLAFYKSLRLVPLNP